MKILLFLAILLGLITCNPFVQKYNIRTYGNGDSGIMPYSGDELELKYEGFLPNKTPFDSAYRGTKTFRFLKDKGQVIACWENVLSRVAVGDRIRITCPPDEAYGQTGSPALNIAPNTPLDYDLEIMSVIRAKDLNNIEKNADL